MLKKKIDFTKKLDDIIKMAEETGADTSLLYITTLKRYKIQLMILDKLEAAIAENGTTVEKEYVKGRVNIVINPAITEYNRTASAANQTAQTLIKIIQAHNDGAVISNVSGDDEM